ERLRTFAIRITIFQPRSATRTARSWDFRCGDVRSDYDREANEDPIQGRRAGRRLRNRTHPGYEEEPAERGRRRLRGLGAGPWHAGRNPSEGPLQRGKAVDPGIPQGHGDRESACAHYVSAARRRRDRLRKGHGGSPSEDEGNSSASPRNRARHAHGHDEGDEILQAGRVPGG